MKCYGVTMLKFPVVLFRVVLTFDESPENLV